MKRLITIIIALAVLIQSAGQGHLSRAASRDALRPIATSHLEPHKQISMEDQVRKQVEIWFHEGWFNKVAYGRGDWALFYPKGRGAKIQLAESTEELFDSCRRYARIRILAKILASDGRYLMKFLRGLSHTDAELLKLLHMIYFLLRPAQTFLREQVDSYIKIIGSRSITTHATESTANTTTWIRFDDGFNPNLFLPLLQAIRDGNDSFEGVSIRRLSARYKRRGLVIRDEGAADMSTTRRLRELIEDETIRIVGSDIRTNIYLLYDRYLNLAVFNEKGELLQLKCSGEHYLIMESDIHENWHLNPLPENIPESLRQAIARFTQLKSTLAQSRRLRLTQKGCSLEVIPYISPRALELAKSTPLFFIPHDILEPEPDDRRVVVPYITKRRIPQGADIIRLGNVLIPENFKQSREEAVELLKALGLQLQKGGLLIVVNARLSTYSRVPDDSGYDIYQRQGDRLRLVHRGGYLPSSFNTMLTNEGHGIIQQVRLVPSPSNPLSATDAAAKAPSAGRTTEISALSERIRDYHHRSWNEQTKIRADFIPYLLQEDMHQGCIGLLDCMLESESRRLSREIYSLDKNIASIMPYSEDSKERTALEEKRRRLLALFKVFDDLKSAPARKIRILKICRAYFLNPTIPTRQLHNALKRITMSYQELLENYRVVQRLGIMQDMFIYDSVHQRLAGYIKEQLILREKLEAVFAKTEGSSIMPFAVEFHPALGCNAQCLGCPNIDCNREFIKYKKVGEPLSLEKIKMLVDLFLAAGVERITFAGGGEPLVYRDIIKAIEYTRKKSPSVNIALYTNGIGLVDLSQKEREILVRSLNRLRVSMDASNPEDWAYYKGRPGEKFYQIWQSLRDMASKRERTGSGIKIGASCIVSLSCQDRKVLDFIKLCKGHNLDFCDIKALSESSAEKGKFQAETSGFMDVVDEIMATRQRGDYGSMHVALEDVFVIDWYSWKLGIKREELPTPHRCWMSRAGRKLTIGPYGGMYPCSDAANPGILKVLEGEPRMNVLNDFSSPQNLRGQFLKLWADSRGKRDSFDPPTHPYCVPSNNDYNVAVEKLYTDWDYGIPLEDQPIAPESYTYLESRGIAGTGSIKSSAVAARYTSANRQNLARLIHGIKSLAADLRELSFMHLRVDSSQTGKRYASLIKEAEAVGSFAISHLCHILRTTKNTYLCYVLLSVLSELGPEVAEKAIPSVIDLKKEILAKSSTEDVLGSSESRFDDAIFAEYVHYFQDALNKILINAGPAAAEAVGVLREELRAHIAYYKNSREFDRGFTILLEVLAALGPAAEPLIQLAADYYAHPNGGFLTPDDEKIVIYLCQLGPVAAPFRKELMATVYGGYLHSVLFSGHRDSDFPFKGDMSVMAKYYMDIKTGEMFEHGWGEISHTENLYSYIMQYMGSIGSAYAAEYIPLILECMDATDSWYFINNAAYALRKIGEQTPFQGTMKIAPWTKEEIQQFAKDGTNHMQATLDKYRGQALRIDPEVIGRALAKAQKPYDPSMINNQDIQSLLSVQYHLLSVIDLFDFYYTGLHPQLIGLLRDTHSVLITGKIVDILYKNPIDLTPYASILISKLKIAKPTARAKILKLLLERVDLSANPEARALLETVRDMYAEHFADGFQALSGERVFSGPGGNAGGAIKAPSAGKIQEIPVILAQLNGICINDKDGDQYSVEVLPHKDMRDSYIIRVNAGEEQNNAEWIVRPGVAGLFSMSTYGKTYGSPCSVGIILLKYHEDIESFFIEAVDFNPKKRKGLYTATIRYLASLCPPGTKFIINEISEPVTHRMLCLNNGDFMVTPIGKPFVGTGFEVEQVGLVSGNLFLVQLSKKTSGTGPMGTGRQRQADPSTRIDQNQPVLLAIGRAA